MTSMEQLTFCIEKTWPLTCSSSMCPCLHPLSSPLFCSGGLQRRLQPEQAADRRARPDALQELPQQRQALCGGKDRHGRLRVHTLHPLVVGLERYGCQPGWHRPGWDGPVCVCPGDGNGQHGDHGRAVGALSLSGQRGTAVVSLGFTYRYIQLGSYGNS